jgi:uncharacterized protein YodC (DUF2158 family)
MKHHYNDTTLQAAIDCALEKVDTNSGSLVSLFHYPNTFASEAPARLALLKSVLDRLPEPPPPTVDGKTPGQVAYENRFPVAAGRRAWRDLIISERDKWQHTAQAVLAAFGGEGKARAELAECHARLLDTTAGAAVVAERASRYAAELEPLVTKPISLPEWTPKVGDVVTLRSGGPKMTVMRSTDSELRVIWFHDGVPRECDFLISTLTLA